MTIFCIDREKMGDVVFLRRYSVAPKGRCARFPWVVTTNAGIPVLGLPPYRTKRIAMLFARRLLDARKEPKP